jgi:hypothetical protein
LINQIDAQNRHDPTYTVRRKPSVPNKRGDNPAASRIKAIVYKEVLTGVIDSAAIISAPPIIRPENNCNEEKYKMPKKKELTESKNTEEYPSGIPFESMSKSEDQ